MKIFTFWLWNSSLRAKYYIPAYSFHIPRRVQRFYMRGKGGGGDFYQMKLLDARAHDLTSSLIPYIGNNSFSYFPFTLFHSLSSLSVSLVSTTNKSSKEYDTPCTKIMHAKLFESRGALMCILCAIISRHGLLIFKTEGSKDILSLNTIKMY